MKKGMIYIKWGRKRTVRSLRGEGTSSSQISSLRYPPCRDNFPSSNLCTDSEWYPIHWKSNSEQVYFISCLRRVQKLPETIPIHEPYWIPVLLWTVNGTTFDLTNRGAQRSFLKGDKVLCLLRLGVLPHTLGGGGVRRCFFEEFFIYAPDSPSRSRLQAYQSGVVYNVFRSDTRQDPTDMKKAIPSL
jgi:hypothetical protein